MCQQLVETMKAGIAAGLAALPGQRFRACLEAEQRVQHEQEQREAERREPWTIYRTRLGTAPAVYPSMPVCTCWNSYTAQVLYEFLSGSGRRPSARYHYWIELGMPTETAAPLHRGQGGYG